MSNVPSEITAVPVAEDVIILGEAIVGGTLNGSYKYRNTAENPEGNSHFQWLVDGGVIATTLSLLVGPEYSGKSIVFSVTPVAVSGEIGATVLSSAKLVVSGFQNITDEENENSFMKQHGNFSFYAAEPADRIFVSTGGAFSLLDGQSQNVYVRGEDAYGAVVPEAIRGYLINNPATVLFSTERDFAALVPLGRQNQLLVWGNNIPNNVDLTKLRNIKGVYSNGSAFAYIHSEMTSENKWIGAVGNAANGGLIPDSVHLRLVTDPPVAIYAAYEAFVVLTTRGKVYAWGKAADGGSISASAQALLDAMPVKRIISNMSAFCAIGASGDIVTWGNPNNGGTIPADRLETILDQGGVKSVIAARASFCAVTKGRAKAVSWGLADQGGNMGGGAAELAARGNIVMCKAATWAFCMINASGQVEAWGVANSGGTIPNSTVPAPEPSPMEDLLDLGVKKEVEKYFKQQLSLGASSPVDVDQAADAFSLGLKTISSRIIIGEGNVSCYGNDSSFFLIAQDEESYTNNLWVWGQANGGGSMGNDVRQTLLASRITHVYCTNGAYGVIASQGSVNGVVTVWGATLAQMDAGEIPKTPPEIAQLLRGGVIELYSIKRSPPVSPTPVRVDPSFAARHISGAYVLWGGNVVNQVFTPSDHESFI
ncbi:hypothetical protein [Pseudomonas sp. TE3610]